MRSNTFKIIAVALLIVCLVAGIALASEAEKKDHGENTHQTEESWWRFTGWQTIFSALAVVFYALVINILPRFISDEKKGVEH